MRIPHLFVCLLPIFICGCPSEQAPAPVPAEKDQPAGRVTGIGGVFFKARDPKGMSAWYAQHLGIPVSHGYADFSWREKDHPEEIGHTAWTIFPTNAAHFGQSSTSLMINYRVDNLDKLLERLRGEGVKVEKVEDAGYGRFAWIMDPEGNRVELWEPKKK